MCSFNLSRLLDEEDGSRNLKQYALSLRSERQPVQGSGCIICHVRQEFLASHGVTLVRVVSQLATCTKGSVFPMIARGSSHISTEIRDEIANLKSVYKSQK